MDTYLWVTDDVLHQIKTLDGDSDAKIKEAKKIISRIEDRDLYKMIGEKRVIWIKKNEPSSARIQTKEDLKKWMESELKNEVEKHLFEIQVVAFDYGNGDTNPMKNVKFYQKVKSENPGEEKIQSVDMDETEISAMLPSIFEKIYARLYWKGSRYDNTDDTVRQKKIIIEKFTALKGETQGVELLDVKTRALKE